MLSRALFLPVFVAAVIAPVFADSFEIEDIDDGHWQFIRGNRTCPDEITIKTEQATFVVKDLEAEATDSDGKKPCSGPGKVTLTEDPKSGGDKFQQAIKDNEHSDQIQAGAQTGSIKCGRLTFPDGTFWQFFSPEDEFQVEGSLLPAEKGAIKFSEEDSFLVIGSMCIYKQKARVVGAAEEIANAFSGTKDKVGGAATDGKDTVGA